jgi:hypothetical protein
LIPILIASYTVSAIYTALPYFLEPYSLEGPVAAPIAEPTTVAANPYGFIEPAPFPNNLPTDPVLIRFDAACPPIVPSPVATPAPIPLDKGVSPPASAIPRPK